MISDADQRAHRPAPVNNFEAKAREILSGSRAIGRFLGCQIRPTRWHLCASDAPTPGDGAFREEAVKMLTEILEEGANISKRRMIAELQSRADVATMRLEGDAQVELSRLIYDLEAGRL